MGESGTGEEASGMGLSGAGERRTFEVLEASVFVRRKMC